MPANHEGPKAVDFAECLLPAGDDLAFLRPQQMREVIDRIVGDNHEQGRVDGVDAFAKDRSLPAALAALTPARRSSALVAGFAQEGAGILEVIAGDDAAQGLAGRQRLAVASVDVADFALRNGHQRHLVDAVLPAPKPEMDAAAEQIGLVAGFAVQGDDAAFGHRPGPRPEFFDDADLLVGDWRRVSHEANSGQEPNQRPMDGDLQQRDRQSGPVGLADVTEEESETWRTCGNERGGFSSWRGDVSALSNRPGQRVRTCRRG